MAYTINLTNGAIFAEIPDGRTDETSKALVLVGKNYSGYGEFIGENFVHMLENSAQDAPFEGVALTGQLWFDTSVGTLKVYDGIGFKHLGGAAPQPDAPTNPVLGDIWFDTSTEQMYIYNDTEFILVGPISPAAAGKSGPISVIVDGHELVEYWVNDELVAIMSKDAAFNPATPIAGFTPTIYTGFQLSTSVSGGTPQFTGTATNSLLLNGDGPEDFLSATTSDETLGSLTIKNDGGLLFGSGTSVGRLTVDTSDVVLSNINNGSDMLFKVWAGSEVTALTIDGTTGHATVPNATPTGLEITNADYVDTEITTAGNAYLKHDGTTAITGDLLPTTANTLDLGSPTKQFAAIYSTNFLVGNDLTISDINVANTAQLAGQTNSGIGFIKFGSSGAVVGCNGSAALTVNGSTVWHTGNDTVLVKETDYATSSVGGTLKARAFGTTLYLTNNGVNA